MDFRMSPTQIKWINTYEKSKPKLKSNRSFSEFKKLKVTNILEIASLSEMEFVN